MDKNTLPDHIALTSIKGEITFVIGHDANETEVSAWLRSLCEDPTTHFPFLLFDPVTNPGQAIRFSEVNALKAYAEGWSEGLHHDG